MSLVILAVTILVAIIIIKALRTTSDNLDTDAACVAQITAHSAIVRVTKEISSPSITCPTRVISLETTDEDTVKAKLASEMLKCWNTWGRGEQKLFGSQERVYCHVCSMVAVQGVSSITGFSTYLDTTEVKDGMTYSALLQGKKSGTYFSDTEAKKAALASFPTDKPVGVVFMYAKGKTSMEKVQTVLLGNPAAGATVGAVGGAAIGYFAAGAIISLTGAGTVAGIVMMAGAMTVGAGTGAGAGFLGSLKLRPDSSYMSLVVVRPLTTEQISNLGCDYAPAGN